MKRPGVTLVEVLVAIFVMAIGMMAILTLFPLGAMSMAEALQNDRCGTAANTAAAMANAKDVRTDPVVAAALAAAPGGYAPLSSNVPSYPVSVDPFGTIGGYPPLGSASGTPGIARCTTSFVGTSSAQAARWFSVLDDMQFDTNGVPSGGGASVNRPGRYTWSYLVRQPRSSVPPAVDPSAIVDLWIVVYYNRPTGTVDGESVYAAAGNQGESSVILAWNSATDKPAVRRNTWVLDVSYDATNLVHGDFYRVVSAAESGSSTTVCELETPLKKNNISQFVVLEYAAEVFYKGAGPPAN